MLFTGTCLLQVNFLPLDEALDGNAAPVSPVSMPALVTLDVTNAPPTSAWHKTGMSGLETAAATGEPSLAGSLSSVDDWDDGRTASWVCEQSSIDESPDSDCPPPPSEVPSPASRGPVGAVDSPTAVPAPPPQPSPANLPQASYVDSQLTSLFGRVIGPVCRLIEFMAQFESILGVEPSSRAVIHV